MTKKIPKVNISKLKEDYAINLEFDDDEMVRMKEIVLNELDDIDRIIILLYAEQRSMRKVAKTLKVSPATACIKINEIREKIKDLL